MCETCPGFYVRPAGMSGRCARMCGRPARLHIRSAGMKNAGYIYRKCRRHKTGIYAGKQKSALLYDIRHRKGRKCEHRTKLRKI